MRDFWSPDGNSLSHIVGRPLLSCQPHTMRALQMHSSLVQRLNLDNVLEGHHGCVNSIAWNANGSLLVSGSDDTKVNLWDYGRQKLLYSIDTGHYNNIFCTKFMPESGDDVVVSAAGDAEVRVHRVSRSSPRALSSEQTAVFRCHTRRVKKLAVEDGNPHVVWSASEDGTLRQHDFREGIFCPHLGLPDPTCRNILVDLRNGQKRSLSDSPRHCLALKTCAINPRRPHMLLIGGSDAFARMYDRRMLPPPTTSGQLSKPPPCVSYFCPAHLSDHNRSRLHLTHVTFSPDGQEILLSYSGEHVYLMDANCGQTPVVYLGSDVSKKTTLSPTIDDENHISLPVTGSISLGHRHNFPWLQECKELLEEAKFALEEGTNYTYAIEATGEVLHSRGQAVDATLHHDCQCVRASALLKRRWKNDVHMAIRDLNDALRLNPRSSGAHHFMAEALAQLGRFKEALDFALRSQHLDPADTEVCEHILQLRTKIDAEEARVDKAGDNDSKLEFRAPRIWSINDLLSRTENLDTDESSDTHFIDREDSDYFDDDIEEMEMEFEMTHAEEALYREVPVHPGPTLRLRLRHTGIMEGKDHQMGSASPPRENGVQEADVAVDMKQRYIGHCNTGTDIKQASFLGEQGEYVASGSDDGRWFIWLKRTGRLIKVLVGDENVVNCVQSHPYDCAVATSGIDNTIKLWAPNERYPSESTDHFEVMVNNQSQIRRHGGIGLPLELLHRFRVQEGAEGTGHPFQCTQS